MIENEKLRLFARPSSFSFRIILALFQSGVYPGQWGFSF